MHNLLTDDETHRPGFSLHSDRQIRVFISSTFWDMQDERDTLIKKIFPQLRKVCEERAVTWTEVDLRWGITDEENAEDKVLPLCLEEIDRCRPYFIGLLGERYGWVPQEIPDELVERQPWLREHREQSVTELEMQHGVLRWEGMYGQAFFYFRDPNYLDAVPTDRRQDFSAENAVARGKLEKLKQRIRSARDDGLCELRENYATPEQLGEWILDDCTRLIDRVYPKDQTLDSLDKEAACHNAYARSRRLGFIGREDFLRRLYKHCAAPDKPLVLTGESGCGKSALLAEWVARWRNDHPSDLVIQHYIGSAPDSADWQRLVHRILGELKRAFTITDDIPIQPDALRSALNEWIVKATDSRRVVLAIDALNHLGDRGADQQLGWLPVVFPANFCVLVSSLPGESLDALRKRGWSELYVPLFVRDDIAPATQAYFKIFSKIPPKDLIEKLESTPAACNALYLRAVLDELRQCGKHDELKGKATDYLSAQALPELFDRILARWEKDFGADLVRDSLSLIWAARRGLSEAEILDLLGTRPTCDVFRAYSRRSEIEMRNLLKEIRDPREPIPHAKWTPFFLALEFGLVVRAGLLTFSHSYLRAAVEQRYLPTSDARRSAHDRLALYFELASLSAHVGSDGSLHIDEAAVSTLRALDEEPWQLQAACRWEDLANHLTFLPVFRAACASGREFEWMQYWQHILSAEKKGAVPPMDIGSLYLTGFRRLGPDEKTLLGGTLGQFLYALDYFDAARECFGEEGKAAAFAANRFLRAGSLNDQGLIARDRGYKQEALRLFEEAAAILEETESTEAQHEAATHEHRLLASILMNKVSVIRDKVDRSQCRFMLERALALMKETTGERSLEVATVLQGMGNFAQTQGDFKDALTLQLQAHAIRCEQLGKEHRDVGLSLGNAANALARLGQHHYSICLWERSLEILKKIVGDEHHFSQEVCTTLKQCKNLADQAIRNDSAFGLVLLVFNSLSPAENPPDPTTARGARLVAQAIRDNLIEVWDDSFTHHSSIPVLVVSCPGYEGVVSLASKEPIAKRFPESLLTWLEIPRVSANIGPPQALISLLSVRQQLIDWLQRHNLEVLMVKPVMQSGATLDRCLLEFLRRGPRDDSKSPSQNRAPDSDDPNMDLRPMAIEVVPFDQRDGPLLGISAGDQDPRPCIIPTADWQHQKYSPQTADKRATGVIYFNVPGIQQWLVRSSGTGLTQLDEWSMGPLMSMTVESWKDQLRIFESAFSELVLLGRTRPVNCPGERGVRGFAPNSPYRDIEDLLD